MAYEAIPARARIVATVRGSAALGAAWRVFLATRVAVLLVAIFAALWFGPAPGGPGAVNAAKFDEPALTRSLAEPLLSPLARWDAVWYLRIADSGYAGSEARAAFFPAYPALVRVMAAPMGASAPALLVASYLVSLAAFLGALVLLFRLTTLELGRRAARSTLLLLAVFPGALYFGAPYSESLFLLLAVGGFYAARTDRWAWAGACGAGAAATRSAGVLLLVPLAIVWWTARGRRWRDALWLMLGPLGLAAYALFLGLAEGDAVRFLDVQEAWSRELGLPLAGAWEGLTAAVDGVRQLGSGQREVVYFGQAAGDPFRIASMNVMLFAFLVLALVALVGVFRRLPIAYGAWVASALAVPLSLPVAPQPLMSLPRFLAVLFPLFMWLALVCEERRITDRMAAAFAVGLALFTTQFAAWQWIA